MFAVIIIGIFIISVIYAHSRGKEKQTLSRQLFDHSTFMAPINMFMTAFSSLPARQPFFETERFPMRLLASIARSKFRALGLIW